MLMNVDEQTTATLMRVVITQWVLLSVFVKKVSRETAVSAQVKFVTLCRRLAFIAKSDIFERFPMACRKIKTKVITLAIRNRCKQHNEPIRIRSKYSTCNQRQARKNAFGQNTIGFGLDSR